ncbi:o-succinylbenzoate synthase, partial [Enterococcus faecalis]
ETYQVRLPLKTPVVTSYGRLEEKAVEQVEITDEQGNQGFGELVAFELPDYVQETLVTERLIIQQHLIPFLLTEALDQ